MRSFRKHSPIRSPGTASWRAGTARSARRSPLGPERRSPTPGRSRSPRRGCGGRGGRRRAAPGPSRPRRLRAAAAPASCRAPLEEPEPRRQVAAWRLSRAVREGRGGPRGRGAAVTAAAAAPLAGGRPPAPLGGAQRGKEAGSEAEPARARASRPKPRPLP